MEMSRATTLFWAVWVLAVASARAADPNAPHPHNGVLTKYERKHPSKASHRALPHHVPRLTAA